MKKFLVLAMLLVYGLTSTGATIHLHYCCGKLDKISLSNDHNENCPGKENLQKGCCESRKLDLKVEDDQQPGSKWLTGFKHLGLTISSRSFLHFYAVKTTALKAVLTGPPAKLQLHKYLKHCRLRI